MFNQCSGYTPQFQKLESGAYPPGYQAPLYPTPQPYMPDMIIPNPTSPKPMNPINPMPSPPRSPVTPTRPTITPPTQVSPSIPMNPTDNPQMPDILPESPLFSVPTNPLLPPGYQEILSYESLQYLNGFLRTQIGRACEVQFLIGSNETETRSGILVGVGLNYILLQDVATNDVLTCDYYAIKFVRFYY